jgi:ATP phosphoribosyltransferase
MNDVITIALSKGRLAEKAATLLEGAGVDCSQLRDQGRKLVLEDAKGGYRFILVKPSDVPTYVDHGVADLGVVGKDTIMEENRPLYELLDLGFGACRLCIAGFEGAQPKGHLRVATKYPNIARAYYHTKGENIEIIKLNGSVELGPLIALSDVILDIVESGGTLRANGLTVLEEVCQVSARLVANRVSLKIKADRMKTLIDGIDRQLKGR